MEEDYSIKVGSADEFREVAGDLLNRMIPFCVSPVKGGEYAILTVDDGVEVCDTVEDDNYRREVFPDLESALKGFLIGDEPLENFVAGVSVYPELNN